MPTGPLLFQILKFYSFHSCFLQCICLIKISRVLAASYLPDTVSNVTFM